MIIDHNPEHGITLTIAELRETFCVYVQETSEGVFYAGMCRLYDVYKYPDAYRNTHWRQTVTDQTSIKTTVICTSLDINECYHRLHEFVRVVRPICNVNGYMTYGNIVITCVEGPNAGKSYTTQEECARMNGISQPTLSNHLNGRKGYLSVRGMKFKRGLA